MKLIDLTNKRYGKLVVIKKAKNRNKKTMWLCKCDCGKEKIIGGNELKSGNTKSCGCYNLERLHERAIHGMSNTRLYKIWSCMKYRCNGGKYKESYLYKDRGIKLYEPWNNFNVFYDWAKDKYYEGSSIDRIDVNGDYGPDNCRFVDNYIQANNKRNNRFYNYKGEKLTIAELSRKYNINYFALRSRLDKGLNINEAMEIEFLNKNNKFFSKSVNQYDLNGNFIKKYPSMKEIERQLKIETISISKCCRGLQKTAGGYIWEFADNEISG